MDTGRGPQLGVPSGEPLEAEAEPRGGIGVLPEGDHVDVAGEEERPAQRQALQRLLQIFDPEDVVEPEVDPDLRRPRAALEVDLQPAVGDRLLALSEIAL